MKPSSFNRNYKVGKATIKTSKNANVYVYVDVSKGTSTTLVDSSKGVSTIKNHLNSLVNWLADSLKDVSPIKNLLNGPNWRFKYIIAVYVICNYCHKDVHIGFRHDFHNMAAIKQSSLKSAYFISNSREIQKATARAVKSHS